MSNCLFLGIDQGTSGTKYLLINTDGHTVSEAVIAVTPPAQVGSRRLQDPDQLAQSVAAALKQARAAAADLSKDIAGVGLSCQRSGVLVWEAGSGRVLHPMLSWQDCSTKPMLDGLGKAAEMIPPATGLPVNGHYAGGKFAVLQQEFPESDQIVGMLDTFLKYRLSGAQVLSTDDTFASRTMLYRLSTSAWDSELCRLLKVDPARLQEIRPALSTHAELDGTALLATLGDQQSAYWGLNSGSQLPILVLGTVASLLVPTGNSPVFVDGYISNVLSSREAADGKEVLYQIEATANCCGPTIDCIVRQLKLVPDETAIDAACAAALTDCGAQLPVAFFPVGGTGAPDWRSNLPNAASGSNRDNPAALTLALVENIGSFVAVSINAFAEAEGIDMSDGKILVSGGVSRIDHLLQYISDCTGFELLRAESEKGSAFGAALCAARTAGIEIAAGSETDTRVFAPRASQARERLQRWQELQQLVYAGSVKLANLVTIPSE